MLGTRSKPMTLLPFSSLLSVHRVHHHPTTLGPLSCTLASSRSIGLFRCIGRKGCICGLQPQVHETRRFSSTLLMAMRNYLISYFDRSPATQQKARDQKITHVSVKGKGWLVRVIHAVGSMACLNTLLKYICKENMTWEVVTNKCKNKKFIAWLRTAETHLLGVRIRSSKTMKLGVGWRAV
ncbi:hypothetical protein BGX38DRAFT_881545 [Terfezia claveryi]|nr:hypothetical protein BGX38DRAFT_881545 [Terfezia claveryi]